MCTRDKEFTIRGTEDCLARGFDRTGFFEVDTGEQRAWTVQLTDTADRRRSSARCTPGTPMLPTPGRQAPVATAASAQPDETPAPHQDRRHARPRLRPSAAMIAQLFEAGADVFRINMSHTDARPHARAGRRRSARSRSEYGRPIGILVDLQGPKLRVGKFAGGSVDARQRRDLHARRRHRRPATRTRVHLPHPEIFDGVEPGHTLLLDDGKVRLIATEVDASSGSSPRVEVGGKLSDRKGVSLPDTMIPFSALTPKDRSDLEAALDAGIDWIALSFIQRPEDIAEAKKITRGRAAVMAKIEKPQAVTRLDEILDLADALMVARGDLGVEMPLEKVPGIQKQHHARRAPRRQAGGGRDADAGIDDHQPGADPRRGLRRRDRDLRGRRRGDAVGGIGRRAISRSRRSRP